MAEPTAAESLEQGTGLRIVAVGVDVPVRRKRRVLPGHDRIGHLQAGSEQAGQRRAGKPQLLAQLAHVDVTELAPEDLDLTAGGVQIEARETAECRLSRAVRSDHDPPLVGSDTPADPAQDDAVTPNEVDIGELENGRH